MSLYIHKLYSLHPALSTSQLTVYSQVDTKVQGKTGLLVATAEGWPEVVKALLNEFNANPNEPVHI